MLDVLGGILVGILVIGAFSSSKKRRVVEIKLTIAKDFDEKLSDEEIECLIQKELTLKMNSNMEILKKSIKIKKIEE